MNPAAIISCFTDEEEQRKVAGMFNASLGQIETNDEKVKALNDTIYRLKENSIKYASEHLDSTDLKGLQELVKERKNLQSLKQMHIFID